MKGIAISLSPNTEKKDVFLAVGLMFSPWVFIKTDHIRLLEQWFRSYLGVSHAVSFNSGRASLFAILKALGINKNDEVIMQAFTCAVVANAIIAAGARPVYVDVDKSLTIDVSDLEEKITKKTKAIIVQHTFAIPSDMDKINKLAKKNKICVIEDSAHAIGAFYNHKKLGTLADAAFFSFGRDKAFSSVFGGMAVTKNKELGRRIREYQKKMAKPSFFWTMQQLFHPVAFFFILPFYDILYLGKIMLVIFQKTRLLSFPVSKEEKRGSFLNAKKLPNALAFLALSQLKRLRKFNKHREEIAEVYKNGLDTKAIDFPSKDRIPFLRFPILLDNRDGLIDFLRAKNIYIGKWYSEVIDPKGVDLKNLGYRRGSCPNAEYFAKRIGNLPTHPRLTLKEAKLIKDLVNSYVKSKRI
ncbi:MAG: aminotransferase class I/II-fold pyridoxal phosphate-dependent enzyme [Patescibacteria group bacterium]|nr:aminotransferase class I/II-fold pyridoxal phosphate-dependent enzyme [Patescibacteria group bacterium]